MSKFLSKYKFQNNDWNKVNCLLEASREFTDIQDEYARIELLINALAWDKNLKISAQSSDNRNRPAGLRKFILDGDFDRFLKRIFDKYETEFLAIDLPDLESYPIGSWTIQLPFTLGKPYISKDDIDFYIIDNPVKKEKIFKLPYMAATAWKGALRSAMVQTLVRQVQSPEEFARQRFQIALICGDEKGDLADENQAMAKFLDQACQDAIQLYRGFVTDQFGNDAEGKLPSHAGRLHFYPTYFDRIGLEIINPHERETGAGKDPIQFECVPENTTGWFHLFYFPHDRIGMDEKKTVELALSDLALVTKGLQAMFIEYGFGAKTSSGFGLAHKTFPQHLLGKMHIKVKVSDGRRELKPNECNNFETMVFWAEEQIRS
jgi:CRISPR-associated protein Cmr2